ncbi:hypothetical protein BH11BAC2_BH11BAC2_16780 [soil metagenome]
MKINLLLAILILVASCKNHTAKMEDASISESEVMLRAKYISATIVDKSGLDGCGFLVALADGSNLEVFNLPDSVKKDQLKVWIKYIPDAGASSICMAGKIVKLTDLKLRSK